METPRGVRRYSLAKTLGAGIGRSSGSRSSQVNCSSAPKVNTSAQGQIFVLLSTHQRLLIPTNYSTGPIGFLEHRYEHEVHHLDHSCGLRCPLHCSRTVSCHFRQLAKLRCKFFDNPYAFSLLTNAIETMRQHSPRPMQSRCLVHLWGPGLHHEHFLLHRDSMLAVRPTK